jgi:hypothetical protein
VCRPQSSDFFVHLGNGPEWKPHLLRIPVRDKKSSKQRWQYACKPRRLRQAEAPPEHLEDPLDHRVCLMRSAEASFVADMHEKPLEDKFGLLILGWNWHRSYRSNATALALCALTLELTGGR